MIFSILSSHPKGCSQGLVLDKTFLSIIKSIRKGEGAVKKKKEGEKGCLGRLWS
jgi:hypothetical protein